MAHATGKDLAVAAREGKLEAVDMYLKLGISPNEVVEFGGTALTHAAVNGHAAIVQLLLDSGALVNAVTAVRMILIFGIFICW
jgi:ankyrin repeat protein